MKTRRHARTDSTYEGMLFWRPGLSPAPPRYHGDGFAETVSDQRA